MSCGAILTGGIDPTRSSSGHHDAATGARTEGGFRSGQFEAPGVDHSPTCWAGFGTRIEFGDSERSERIDEGLDVGQ